MKFTALGIAMILAFLVSLLLLANPVRPATIDTFKAKPQMLAPYWPPARVWMARGTCTVTKNGKCVRARCKGRHCV